MITTIKIDFTEAKVLRCVANRDMPEYGLKEGQIFYCAKSNSLGDNQYHILTWNFEAMAWNCPCECGEKRNHLLACGHTKAASRDCSKPHVIQSYKPLSKGHKFALLLVRYDIRFQSPVIEAEEVAEEAFKQPIASIADRGVLNNANAGFSIERR